MQERKHSKITVLVVDGDPVRRSFTNVVLRNEHGPIVEAGTAEAARAVVTGKGVDVVVAEGGAGVESEPDMWRLLDDLVADGISVLMLVAGEPAAMEARRRGAVDSLVRPFVPQSLRDAVLRHADDSHDRARFPMIRGVRAKGRSRDDHADSAELEDRLAQPPSSPGTTESEAPADETISFAPGKLERASLAWGLVALATILVASVGVDGVPFVPWLVLTGIATAISTWTALYGDRSAYDAAFPIKVALGVAVGGLAAPLALSAQGLIAGLATGASTKARFRTTMVNVGVLALEGFTLGIGIRFLVAIPPTGRSGFLLVLAGLVVAIAVAIGVNYGTVRLTLRYLTGRPSPMPMHWLHHLRDVVSGTLLGLVVVASAESGWLAAVAVAVAGAVIVWRLREVQVAQQATYLEIQAQIVGHEQRHAPLADHTLEVVALVEELAADLPEAERARAVAAAWCHTLSTGGWPDRCSGGHKPPLSDQVGHLPRRWNLTGVLEATGRVRLTERGAPLDVAAMVGLACAVDALRLERGQVRTEQDIHLAWGYSREAIQRAVVIHDGRS